MLGCCWTNLRLLSWIALGLFLASPSVVHAVPTITLSTYLLQPDTPNQTINIYVSGGNAVSGVDLEVTTGDGGVSGNFPAPVITSVNLFPAGGIFTGNNTGTSGYGQATGGQFYEATTTTLSGTVNLGTTVIPALLATVTLTTAPFSYTFNSADPQEQSFSTSEFVSGSYSISVGGTMSNGPIIYTEATDFPPDSASQTIKNPTLTDGILVVPEPRSLGLLALALPALLLRRPRGRRVNDTRFTSPGSGA